MRRKSVFVIGLIAATAIGGVAYAASNHGAGRDAGSMHSQGMMMNQGPGHGMMGQMSDMMQMMKRAHGQMGGGQMGGMGPVGGAMMQAFDADDDGTVTPEEARAGLESQLTEYDTDEDGSLSIAEFETLHSAKIRELMVDRFQHLDADGDGQVTQGEITAPAERMERMQQMRTQMMDGSANQQGMSNRGSMMNDN